MNVLKRIEKNIESYKKISDCRQRQLKMHGLTLHLIKQQQKINSCLNKINSTMNQKKYK